MNVIVNKQVIEVHLTALERFFGCHISGHIEVPLENIQAVRLGRPETPWWAELRAPGTHLPGLFKAGTYYTKAGREFWYVRNQQPLLWLSTSDYYYKQIVLGSELAEQWRSQIQALLNQTST